MEETATWSTPEDKSVLPPMPPKRIVAFVNHFLISSCQFLNEFAERCESKFLELERKMQKVEAALIILECKLDSVPVTEIKDVSSNSDAQSTTVAPTGEDEDAVVAQTEDESKQTVEEPPPLDTMSETSGVRACDDTRYRKFYKMLQFGVPAEAVKLKMRSEGIANCEILDTPNLLLADGIKYVEPEQ